MYIGYDPKNENVSSPMLPRLELANSVEGPKDNGVNQRDADLLHFWHKVFANHHACSILIFRNVLLIYQSTSEIVSKVSVEL